MKKSFFANRALAFSLLLALAIAATEVPLWVTAFAGILLVWRAVYEKFGIYKISTKITPILGALIFAIVYLQYRTILGQEESTTVLVGLASISVLNYDSDRDSLFLVLLGFLIVVIKSIFSLDFVWTVPSIIAFFGLWMSLLTNKHLNKAKYLFASALRSVPIFLILFIFFPRFVIFQSKPQKVHAQSGFSEEMNPGRFSEVAMQDQIVFRAEFNNNFMHSEELYWRGAVLSIGNGFSWKKAISTRWTPRPPESDETSLGYRIILEPMNLKNIFMLERPVGINSASSSLLEFENHTYALNDIPTQQVQYTATATMGAVGPNAPDEDDSTEEHKYKNPGDLMPKTKQFVEEIKAKKLSVRDRLEVLHRFFSDKGFVYTLQPDKYGNDMDEFLFVRKRGFCEHFAAAYAILARALDIPSRVVIGYQGGVYNSMGNFWKISQRDAHAWVEVGVNGVWERIDPTSWVAPLRLAFGGENYFSLSEDEQILYARDRNWKRPDGFLASWAQVKSVFDNLNYHWTILLLNYDLQAQLDYLKQIRVNNLMVGLLAIMLLVMLIYGRKKIKASPNSAHGMQSLIEGIELWGARQGLEFSPERTPLQTLSEMGERFPQLHEPLQEIAQNYISLVYQNKLNPIPVERLKKNWQRALRKSPLIKEEK